MFTFTYEKTNKDYEITKNLKLSEVNTGKARFVRIHPLLIIVFRLLRDDYGHPLYMSSGFRDFVYNRSNEVGSNDDSQHPLGTALDIKTHNIVGGVKALAKKCEEAIKNIKNNGHDLVGNDYSDYVCRFIDFNIQGGIGIYHKKNFVHIDVRKDKARWNG